VSFRQNQPSHLPIEIVNLADVSLASACHFGGKYAKFAVFAAFGADFAV
jgi:hypothetical protein